MASVNEKLEIPQLEPSRRRTIVVVVALLLAAAIGTYFTMRDKRANPYRVVPVSRTSIIKEVAVTGHLELIDEVEVPAPIEGQLVKVFVQPGDNVELGQLLAQLDKDPAEIAFAVARAELDVARARVSEAEVAAQRASEALARTKRLAQENLASKSAVEVARAEMAKTRAAVQGARAERAAAQERASLRGRESNRTDIVAPRAGLVLETPDRIGMIVGPKDRLFRVGAPVDQMYITAPIGEADIGEVRLGLDATFEVPTYPGRVFVAEVKHISPDPQTEYGAVFYNVRLATENPDHLLLPGMTAQIHIKVAQVDDVLAVREATLRFTPAGASAAPPRSRVWRVRGEAIEEVPVETGLSDGAITEVRPREPATLEVDDPVVIGLAMDGNGSGNGDGQLLSLRGRR